MTIVVMPTLQPVLLSALVFCSILVCVCQVELLVGKDKGKQGLVNCIIKERNWVYVDGLNCVRA